MIDQMLEGFRKISESSLHTTQDLFKTWTQNWATSPLTTPGEWSDAQKRWQEAASEALNKHRAVLDATYKSGIELIEHTFRFTEARSPEDYRRLVEELWRKLTDTFKAQSENQYREIQNVTEKWMDKSQSQSVRSPSPS